MEFLVQNIILTKPLYKEHKCCFPWVNFKKKIWKIKFDLWMMISFLVACTRLYNPLCPSVGRLVGWLVGRLVTLYFFYDFISLTSLLLPKWSGDLKYGPCPPARDFGSRVSSLVPKKSHMNRMQ